MCHPAENDCYSRRLSEACRWLSWLLVVAIVLNAGWVPLHLATEHHVAPDDLGATAHIEHALAHLDVGNDHHASGTDDDHGHPHHPHQAIDHKAPWARAGSATKAPPPHQSVLARYVDPSPPRLEAEPRRLTPTAATGPPSQPSSTHRLARAPPAS